MYDGQVHEYCEWSRICVGVAYEQLVDVKERVWKIVFSQSWVSNAPVIIGWGERADILKCLKSKSPP